MHSGDRENTILMPIAIQKQTKKKTQHLKVKQCVHTFSVSGINESAYLFFPFFFCWYSDAPMLYDDSKICQLVEANHFSFAT